MYRALQLWPFISQNLFLIVLSNKKSLRDNFTIELNCKKPGELPIAAFLVIT